jgi:uncharacterized protein (DUF433 family)
MIDIPEVVILPLHKDKDGVIRVGNTRVTLETVIAAYKRGDSPEKIVDSFDVLKLEDVHLVIGYYLSHRDEVDAYIREVDREGEQLRQKFESLPSHKPITRATLEKRLEAKRREQK